MNWYKVKLTKEDLINNESTKIHEIINTTYINTKDNKQFSSFATQSSTNPETIYVSEVVLDLCTVLKEYNFSPCATPSEIDLSSLDE